MADFQLYCFAQSGNAYRAALMLNLIGADIAPQLTVPTYPGTRLAAPSRQCQVLADRLGDAIPVVFVELAAHASDQAEALREARPD